MYVLLASKQCKVKKVIKRKVYDCKKQWKQMKLLERGIEKK